MNSVMLKEWERWPEGARHADRHSNKTAVSLHQVMEKSCNPAKCLNVTCLLPKWSFGTHSDRGWQTTSVSRFPTDLSHLKWFTHTEKPKIKWMTGRRRPASVTVAQMQTCSKLLEHDGELTFAEPRASCYRSMLTCSRLLQHILITKPLNGVIVSDSQAGLGKCNFGSNIFICSFC